MRFFFVFLAILCASCGYKLGEGGVSGYYQTMSVPFVKGDAAGELTAALVQSIARSGALRYKQTGAQLILEAEILDMEEDNIGFNYDRHKDGRREKNIIPLETRITAIVQIKVFDTGTGEVVFGPQKIAASVDFDHNYYFGSNRLNKISLGQVTDIDAARDSVRKPLFNALAEKVINAVINSSY